MKNTIQTKLSAKHFFDRPKLRNLQTDYAKAMGYFGLNRGREYSKARHQRVSHHYYDVNKPIPTPPEVVKEYKQLDAEYQEGGMMKSYKKLFGRSMNLVRDLDKKNRQLIRKAEDMDKDLNQQHLRHKAAVQAETLLKSLFKQCGFIYSPYDPIAFEKIQEAVRSRYPGKPVKEKIRKHKPKASRAVLPVRNNPANSYGLNV